MRLTQRQRVQTRLARALEVLAEARRGAAEGFAGETLQDSAARAVAEARTKLVALNVRQYGRPTYLLGGNTGRFTRPNPLWIVGSPNGVTSRTRLSVAALLYQQAWREARALPIGRRSRLVRQWTVTVRLPAEPERRGMRAVVIKLARRKAQVDAQFQRQPRRPAWWTT